MKGITALLNNKMKILGLVLSVLSMMLILISKSGHLLLIPQLGTTREYDLLIWFLAVGLYLISFSREKIEDERIRMIRNRCLLIGLTLTLSLLLVLSFIGIIFPSDLLFDPALDLTLIACAPAALYLILFHAGVHLDSIWNYNEKNSRLLNRSGNKKHLIFLYAAVTTMLILTFLA